MCSVRFHAKYCFILCMDWILYVYKVQVLPFFALWHKKRLKVIIKWFLLLFLRIETGLMTCTHNNGVCITEKSIIG